MSLTINTAIINGMETESGVKNGNSLFVGNAENNAKGAKVLDPVFAQKRAFAQKQAMKLIRDAWEGSEKMTKSMSDMQDTQARKIAELNEKNVGNKEIEEKKAALQEEYGVSSDSTEQKDLELLQKYQDNIKGVSFDEFSDEEIARLKELQNMPRTEYQNRVLALNDEKDRNSIEAQKLQNEIAGLTRSITETQKDQVISQEMIDAKDSSNKIMAAAEKEIVGMIIKEGMDQIDEDIEEVKEQAEELKEQKEEQQERIDETKEKREEQEELLDADAKADKMSQNIKIETDDKSNINEAQKEIRKILEDNNLINEDLKGINIDFGF